MVSKFKGHTSSICLESHEPREYIKVCKTTVHLKFPEKYRIRTQNVRGFRLGTRSMEQYIFSFEVWTNLSSVFSVSCLFGSNKLLTFHNNNNNNYGEWQELYNYKFVTLHV